MNTRTISPAANYRQFCQRYHLKNTRQSWRDYMRYLEELQIFASLIGEKR